jgi:hypothetical protein
MQIKYFCSLKRISLEQYFKPGLVVQAVVYYRRNCCRVEVDGLGKIVGQSPPLQGFQIEPPEPVGDLAAVVTAEDENDLKKTKTFLSFWGREN